MIYRGVENPTAQSVKAWKESVAAGNKGVENPTVQSVKAWKESVAAGNGKELCDDCIKACPSGALRPISEDQLRMGTAVVDTNICEVYVYGTCTFDCVYACPVDAITIAVGPVVDAEKCVGCNICALACITLPKGRTSIRMQPADT